MAASNKHVYWLCDSNTVRSEEGRRIETGLNMDTCKDFESFIRQLLKRGEITEQEAESYSSAYYDWAVTPKK